MAALPYMAWYPRDYLADTTHLTTLQHGAYFLLLQAMWLHGGKLPADEAQLAGIAKVTGGDWGGIWHVVRPFFRKNRHGQLVQKRLTAEHKKAQRIHDAKSVGGRIGNDLRWHTDRTPNRTPIARARATEPEADKKNLKGRRLRPGASARQRAGGALAPAPAGEAREPGEQAPVPASTVGGIKPVGRALPKHLRVPDPETSRANSGDGFRAADREREELRQRAYDFAAQRYPDAQRRAAFLGLGGADPEHDAEWWLDTLNECMEVEQWQQT